MIGKLGILATDYEMKKTIEELYLEETQSGKFMIEILDKEHMEEQGPGLELKGARVIIGRSGTYERSVGTVSVPLLRLKVTSSEVFDALIKGLEFKKKMVLIIWDKISFDKSWLDFIPCDVEIHTFSDGNKIAELYETVIAANPDCIIVGGGVACSRAREDGIQSVFINASVESIMEIVDHAREVLYHLNSIDHHNELLGKTLNSVRDAVIAIDKNGKVRHRDIWSFTRRNRIDWKPVKKGLSRLV
jgi:propionate catabolism operon transcriptional regulator